MIEALHGSRCPECGWVVAPATRICPRHPVEMIPVELDGHGSVVSYTTLTSAPEGFKAPLHIAVVELQGGARIFCHGREARELKIGRRVMIEQVDGVFYFAHLGMTERIELFWKRRGAAPERTTGALKSIRRLFSFKFGSQAPPPAAPEPGAEAGPSSEERPEKTPVEKS